MSMPDFTAEAALVKSEHHYAGVTAAAGNTGVVPQLTIQRYPGFTIIWVEGVEIIIPGGTVHSQT
jgi:hypothetical protein